MNNNTGCMLGDLTQTDVMSRRAALALIGSVGLTAGVVNADAEGTSDYLTTRAITSAVVPQAVKRVVTRGYSESDDGGGASWVRVPQYPKHPGYVTDATGAVFEVEDCVLFPEMFGARGGDHDDYIAIQRAVSTATISKRRLEFRHARYSFGGEIFISADAEKFALIGIGMTELMQLQDNKCIFLFGGENTHHWEISGFRFAWLRDQTPANRNAYAVRFESDRAGGAGHWNFTIGNCILVNGFRGFGQSDDGRNKRSCPVWGATFRHIHSGLNHKGAAIFLKTFGKTGQPNNRIEHFYARSDSCSEPAIIIESSDTTVLTSIEINRGSGCQILVESSSNFLIQGIRFEHVALRKKDAYLVATGRGTNLHVTGMSVQSMELVSEDGSSPAIVRALNGARVKMDGFTDMPWRAPGLLRDERVRNSVAVVDASGGGITVGFVAPLFDPALTLVRATPGSNVRFMDADNYDFAFEGKGALVFAKKLVRQRAEIVAVALFANGVGDDILRGFIAYSDGKPILFGRHDLAPMTAARGVFNLPEALKAGEPRFVLEPGCVLSLSLPDFTPQPHGITVMVSLVAVGV